MKRARCDQKPRRNRRGDERHEIDALLVVPIGEPSAERRDQEEREHHLGPRQRNPQLVQELDQLPIALLA